SGRGAVRADYRSVDGRFVRRDNNGHLNPPSALKNVTRWPSRAKRRDDHLSPYPLPVTPYPSTPSHPSRTVSLGSVTTSTGHRLDLRPSLTVLPSSAGRPRPRPRRPITIRSAPIRLATFTTTLPDAPCSTIGSAAAPSGSS